MKVFLYCDSAFALKIDGQLNGCHAEVGMSFSRPRLIEALPLCGGEPVCLFADYRLKSNKNAVVHSIEDGYFIKLKFQKPIDEAFKIHYQKSFSSALVTVYSQGGTRIVCENGRSADVCEVPCGFTGFTAMRSSEYILVYTSGTPKFVAVFRTDGAVCLKYANVVDEFEITHLFQAKTQLYDLERSTALARWRKDFSGVDTLEITKEHPIDTTLGKEILRRLFFERILLDISTEDLLSDALKPHADKLKDYLGDFIDILPEYCSKKGVCLSYHGEDRRPVKTFDIELSGCLISNVKEV